MKETNIQSTRQLIKYILFTRIGVRLAIMLLAFIASIAGISVPYFQKYFLDQHSLIYFFLCAALALFSFLGLQLTSYWGQREALIVQQSLASSLYQHILQLKPLTTNHKTVGEMVALYTTDIPSATMWLEQTLPYALTTAFPILIAPLFLYFIYAIPFTLTLVILATLIGLNMFLAFRQSRFFFQFKMLAGQRMGMVNEWIQNIRSLKSLNWIAGFENRIIRKRKEETANRVAMVTNGQIMNSLSSNVTFWLNFFVLVFILYFQRQLLQKVDLMTLLWVMGVFLSRPLRQLPWFFTMMFDAWTSVNRLGDFFALQNKPSHIESTDLPHELPATTVLCIENMNLIMNEKKLLQQINLKIEESEVIALIGPVGSGKSLLLKSIMNETPHRTKRLFKTQHSYLPQESFVLSATLQENIVFNYDVQKSEQAHCLESLKQAQFDVTKDRIEKGLETIVGERGLNLSGGQKQRLSLARLFYDPKKLLLLDDPFSAVDVGTEKKLIESLLLLKKNKHSFLVTTQRYDFLPYADRILFLEEGRIHFDGTYDQLIADEKFARFISGGGQNEKQ